MAWCFQSFIRRRITGSSAVSPFVPIIVRVDRDLSNSRSSWAPPSNKSKLYPGSLSHGGYLRLTFEAGGTRTYDALPLRSVAYFSRAADFESTTTIHKQAVWPPS